MGTALFVGITVTLRLTVFGVGAFVLGKPPPMGPAEKGGGVSYLCTIGSGKSCTPGQQPLFRHRRKTP
jgi:hypothetical protein